MFDIKKDLTGVKELLSKAIPREKHLFESVDDKDMLFAFCTLLSGKFGQYNSEKLKLAAAAVELLNVAVKRHYQDSAFKRTAMTKTKVDMGLITGDYYYAKAILLVLPLGQEIVRIGAEAIAKIAEGEIDPVPVPDYQRFCDKIRQRSALYRASFHVGCLLCGVSRPLRENLQKFGESLGALRILDGEEKALYKWKPLAIKNFVEENARILGELPEGEGLNDLRTIAAKMRGHLFRGRIDSQ